MKLDVPFSNPVKYIEDMIINIINVLINCWLSKKCDLNFYMQYKKGAMEV